MQTKCLQMWLTLSVFVYIFQYQKNECVSVRSKENVFVLQLEKFDAKMAEMDKKLSHELHLIKRQHSKLMVCAPHCSSNLVILRSLYIGTKIIHPCIYQPLAICCLKPPTRVNNFKQLNCILMSSHRRFGDLIVRLSVLFAILI